MTQLIVRPIDDSRYSKSSQLEYLMMLKNCGSPAYQDAFVRFVLNRYRSQMTITANKVIDGIRKAVDNVGQKYKK